jgi:sensor histidine kinase YesM
MPLRDLFQSLGIAFKTLTSMPKIYITVELTKQENHLLLVISDNGIGFNSKLKKKE